jgi:hypothetical protein
MKILVLLLERILRYLTRHRPAYKEWIPCAAVVPWKGLDFESGTKYIAGSGRCKHQKDHKGNHFYAEGGNTHEW